MKTDPALADTASLFLALGDKTRLRLLNLMRDREVCVSSFTGVLGQSQPKISRHLAYLRNAGVVEVRRDGKWMHYSISSTLGENSRRLLFELFKWMENQDALDRDRTKYRQVFGETEEKPKAKTAISKRPLKRKMATTGRKTRLEAEPLPKPILEHEPEPEQYVHHNELEDFLL